MMPLVQPILVPTKKKVNSKYQTRFDSKFSKIRQFQNDVDNLIQENQRAMSYMKGIKKQSI